MLVYENKLMYYNLTESKKFTKRYNHDLMIAKIAIFLNGHKITFALLLQSVHSLATEREDDCCLQ